MAEIAELALTCPKGIESLLLDEAAALGLEEGHAGLAVVQGRATLETAYRICLWSRLANRVLWKLAEFPVTTTQELYDGVRALPWQDHVPVPGTLSVDFSGSGAGIRHTRFGAQKVKDAVVDTLRDHCGERPSVDPQQPDVRINVRLYRGRASIGIDLSGDSLHERGYRLQHGTAPMKENLAAAILLRAGWPALAAQGHALADPMCGSATLLVEGGLMAADCAPGLLRRRWGFDGWLGHVPVCWRRILEEAEQRAAAGRARAPAWIRGYEADPRMVQPARNNIERAGLSDWIKIYQGELADFAPHPDRGQPGLVVCNPPYGERLGDEAQLVYLYQHLGERLRTACDGWQGAVFTGAPELGKRMGLRSHRQYALWNGPIPCKLLLFDIGAAAHVGRVAAPDAGEGGAPAAAPLTAGAAMFANRLQKNRRNLRRWLQREQVECYRLYDADMPEYAVAVDVYRDHVHVQEYAAPKSVDEAKARERLHEVLSAIPVTLDVPPGHVVVKRRERQSGAAQYERQSTRGEFMEVQEGGARLLVNLRDYLDTGLFLDHRPLRMRIRHEAAGKRFLNLFCYTGTASVHAAQGGARSTTGVDLSRTYLEWAGRNIALNGLSADLHRLCRADVSEWLQACGDEFDLVLLDPPTFSNSKRMQGVFDVQRDHVRLLELAMARLAPGGTLYFSNNFRRFHLDESLAARFDVTDISAETLDPDFSRRPDIHRAWRFRHPNR